LLTAVLLAVGARAETSVNAVITGGSEVQDIIGARYKCRLVENESPYIVILFGFHRVWGPNGTYMLESNLYADGLRYADGIVTTWPMRGTYLPAAGSLRVAVQDYFNPVHCGAKTLSPEMFPRQTYLVDGIPDLWKTDMISQTNLNGREFHVEVSRGGLIQDYNDWQGAEALDRNTVFREWRIFVTIDGLIYSNMYAVPEDYGAHLCWYECLNFGSEFFWRSFRFKAFLWDLEIQREQEPYWRRVNEWHVYRQDDPPTSYGVRVTQDSERRVIEVSNDANGGGFMPLDTVLDLSVLPASENPPDLVVSSADVTETKTNEPVGVVTTIANLGGSTDGPVEIGYFLSRDQQIDLNDIFVDSTPVSPSGLAAGESVTFTRDIVLSADQPPGRHYLGVFADYRGAIAELDNSNNARVAGDITVLRFLPLMDNWRMPADFALDGWIREQFPDTRGGRPRVPQEPALLTFAGNQTLQNGSLANTGPIYTGSEFYPYVMLDMDRQWLLLHPSSTHAASVGFLAPRSGTYRIIGTFARANTLTYAGNGVTAAIARNEDASDFLFTASIPSSAAVDPSDLFSGPAAVPFDIDIDLITGDTVRFLVFNGPPGGDIGFDATALEFCIIPPSSNP